MKNIFIINGSASNVSSNQSVINFIVQNTSACFNCTVFESLKSLPHFDPDLSIKNTPDVIIHFRQQIEQADGLIICTPEYVFSIPSGLKNAIEWCIATTIFSEKPLGIITASASGLKGHEALQLIMKTAMTKFNQDTTLLIQGIKGKVDKEGKITDSKTNEALASFITAFKSLIKTNTFNPD